MKKENVINYHLKRFAFKKITDDLGFFYNSDDKFICWIDEKNIKYTKNIILNRLDEHKRKLIEKYNLKNKKIVYVISGVEFNNNISIQGLNGVNIDINNCTFNEPFSINVEGNLTMSNVTFNIDSLTDITADNIKIKNVILHRNEKKEPVLLGIYARENLNISNSFLGYGHENLSLMLKANNEMIFNNFTIDSEIVKLEANNLMAFNNVNIIANKNAIIYSKLYDIHNIYTKEVIFNNIKYNDNNLYGFNSENNMKLEMKRD